MRNLIIGVFVLCGVAVWGVLFIPAASGWMVQPGSVSISMREASGRIWQSGEVDIAHMSVMPGADVCTPPHRGRIVAVTDPIVGAQGYTRVGVFGLERGGREGYHVEFGGWVGDLAPVESKVVFAVLMGEAEVPSSWDGSMIIGVQIDEVVPGAMIDRSLWQLEGRGRVSGPGVTGALIDVLPPEGGFSSARVRSRAMGLGGVEVNPVLTWQAVRDEPALGLFKMFC